MSAKEDTNQILQNSHLALYIVEYTIFVYSLVTHPNGFAKKFHAIDTEDIKVLPVLIENYMEDTK